MRGGCLSDLDARVPGAAAASGECRPPLDVLETTEAVEVVVDVPGMSAETMRVSIHGNAVLVVGAKLGPHGGADGAVSSR